MKRKQLLAAIRAAGYHDEKEKAMALFFGAKRLSHRVYERQLRYGMYARENNLPCFCSKCKESTQ